MKIKLHMPPESIAKIKALGLRQSTPETLRLVTDDSASSYGIGVLRRGKSAEILDGQAFAALVANFGAWIECDSDTTRRRVRAALVTAACGLDDAVRLAAAGDDETKHLL